MSEPAVFVLIRDGQKRYYADRWASVFLFREILWGAKDLEKWLVEGEEIGEWTDDVSGGVVVDFDARKLTWSGDSETLGVPRVAAAYQRLIEAAWPGFQVEAADRGLPDLAAAAGEENAEDYDNEMRERCDTVREAAGLYDEDDDDDEDEDEDDEDEDEAEEEYSDDETHRAWITLIDADGAVRHRKVEAISNDLIDGNVDALDQITALTAAELPPEKVVTEGMWIDRGKREIGFWGGRPARYVFPELKESWGGWSVRWAERGYADQCQISGLPGIAMTEVEALAGFLPTVLSTKRFDIKAIIGVVGGELKSAALKGTGCLLVLICIPILLVGWIAKNMQAALISVGVVCVMVIAIFKFLEHKFTRKFSMNTSRDEDERAPVSGPLDPAERRSRLDQLLAAAGFPSVAEIEPSFPEGTTLDELL